MDLAKIAAVILILAGIVGLVQGGFSYTQRTHEAQIGTLNLSVNENKTVSIPLWASIGAIVVGGGLLLMRGKK
jgi:TRAP-type C4-dicarboxylate transport system permease small subunit